MIDIDNWMRELEEEEDIEIKNNEEYQTKLFEEYVLRGSDHQEERRKLNERYLSGEELMGEHGLRKELAAFDMSYFGRAYLPHYFIRKSPHFHEELDEIWSRGVMKGRNPLKEAKVISRLKGSRQVVAAPRGHAKSTNFTFKDRWGKEGGTTIHQISFTVDISKIKDLPLLYKLIDELKDAQNRTDSPTPATT